MLPLGMLHQRPDFLPEGIPHQTCLSRDEQITLMTLCCIARAPLMFAGDLPANDAWTLSLLTNDEVLAVNQASVDNHECYREGDTLVWTAQAPQASALYLALFNRGASPIEMRVPLDELGITRCRLRDLWAKTDCGSAESLLSAQVPAHGARLLLLR